ncbi:MAG: hypothetical protein ABJW05_00005, partial [Hyphomicrobiales bacterium]
GEGEGEGVVWLLEVFLTEGFLANAAPNMSPSANVLKASFMFSGLILVPWPFVGNICPHLVQN